MTRRARKRGRAAQWERRGGKAAGGEIVSPRTIWTSVIIARGSTSRPTSRSLTKSIDRTPDETKRLSRVSFSFAIFKFQLPLQNSTARKGASVLKLWQNCGRNAVRRIRTNDAAYVALGISMAHWRATDASIRVLSRASNRVYNGFLGYWRDTSN